MFENSPLQPVLPVADIQRAKAWYSDKLGLEPSMEDEDRGMAIYQHAGSMFLLYTTDQAGTNQATAAGFIVDEFDDAVDQLRERGVTFEEVDFGEGAKTVDGVLTAEDGAGKSVWFKDSEGNVLAMSTVPA